VAGVNWPPVQSEPKYDPALRARLQAVLQKRSVIFGDITLASGRKSHYYFDGRMTSLSAEGASLAARLWLPCVRDVAAVGGLTLGADPLVGAILCACGAEQIPMDGFIVRKEMKTHGTMKEVEGPLARGARVVVVEDVVTTGGSVWKAIEAVRGLSCEVARVLALVDREEGAIEFFREKGVPYWPVFRKSEFTLNRSK
jgi:orotate phosphoribosyltransferase